MSFVVAFSILLSVTVGVGLVWLTRQIGSARVGLPVTADWIDELSVERYHPMMRLLDGEDLRFLRSQPNVTPGMAVQLRLQRCQLFRDYLRCLNTDFRRVSMAMRVLMVQSRHDRPDLAQALVRRRVMFTLGMAAAHLRLVFYRWGYCGVDVTGLVQSFDSLRLELQALLPAALSTKA